MNAVDLLACGLAALFILDRLAKCAAVARFFRRPFLPAPEPWPTVTLLQPITRGASALRANLRARAALDYPADVQHLFICDTADTETQARCREWAAQFPELHSRIVLAPADSGCAIASKVAKLQAALPQATGDVLVFVDDDVGLRPDALRVLVPFLQEDSVGAVFGLACYTGWRNLPTSLMSVFVNASALLSYVPLTFFTEPFTITGHCFALRRATFDAVGGLEGMERRIDDDHELARRVRQRSGRRIVQTPLVYDVENFLPTLRAYAVQMKRWFVFPRQALLPHLTRREKTLSLLLSVGNFLPGLLALLALLTRRMVPLTALLVSLGVFAAVYAWGEARCLRKRTPLARWPLLLFVALVTPLQIAGVFLLGDNIEWRGQRLRVRRGGQFEVVP